MSWTPLKDERWQPSLQRHFQASVFHIEDWFEALRWTCE